jgi:hypothetical protein
LGGDLLARGVHRHLVPDRKDSAPTCAPPPKTRRWCVRSASTCPA